MRLHGARRLDTPTPQPLTSGQLILQSAAAEVYFRAIEIRTIVSAPAKFAEF
jgi:hypothetical protein